MLGHPGVVVGGAEGCTREQWGSVIGGGARPVTRAPGSQVAEVEAGEGPAVKVCAC